MPAAQRENHIIYADPELCMGCHSCELACAAAHSGGHDVVTSIALALPLQPRNHVLAVDGVTLPMQCRQCEDAPCTFACPTGALRQADGQVQLVEQHCIGCKLCVMVCPFGAVTVKAERHVGEEAITNRGVASKCDLCVGWRAETGKTVTACVESCPTKAIRLVDVNAYRAEQRRARAREIAASHRHMRISL